jgi:hypothetical protein
MRGRAVGLLGPRCARCLTTRVAVGPDASVTAVPCRGNRPISLFFDGTGEGVGSRVGCLPRPGVLVRSCAGTHERSPWYDGGRTEGGAVNYRGVMETGGGGGGGAAHPNSLHPILRPPFTLPSSLQRSCVRHGITARRTRTFFCRTGNLAVPCTSSCGRCWGCWTPCTEPTWLSSWTAQASVSKRCFVVGATMPCVCLGCRAPAICVCRAFVMCRVSCSMCRVLCAVWCACAGLPIRV